MERLVRLDGLRGVLAVYVMLGHAMPFTGLPAWLAGPFHHGEAAVDLFFCLSGLVVINSLERFGYRWKPFLVARGWRLLPVYWAVLGLACGLLFLGSPVAAMGWVKPGSAASEFWALGAPGGFGWHLAAHIVLVHGLLPQSVLPWAFITLLGPAWSLSTEWQFYVVLAVVMGRGAGPRRLRLVRLVFALAAVAVLYRLGASHLPPGWQFSRAFLPDAAGYFALGLASAVWLRGDGAWPVCAIAVVVVGLGLTSGEASKGLIAMVWLLVLAAQRWQFVPILPRFLESRAVQWLGLISYPLYLLNEPVQRAAAMLVAPAVHGDVALFTAIWLPLAVTAPIAAAAAAHWAIERPLMHGLRPRPDGAAPPQKFA